MTWGGGDLRGLIELLEQAGRQADGVRGGWCDETMRKEKDMNGGYNLNSDVTKLGVLIGKEKSINLRVIGIEDSLLMGIWNGSYLYI